MPWHLELSPRARLIGITTLLDEAHAQLAPEPLEELLLEVRRTLDAAQREAIPAGATAWVSTLCPGLSQGARIYLRPIELLIHAAGEGSPVLSPGQLWQIDSNLDEIRERPAISPVAPVGGSSAHRAA